MLDYDNTTYKQGFGTWWEGGLFAQILLHHAKFLTKGNIRIGNINLPSIHSQIGNMYMYHPLYHVSFHRIHQE